MKKLISLFTACTLACTLSGCGARVESTATAPTYQGSPTIIVNPACKENCGGSPTIVVESKAESRPVIKQEAEATTKSGAWIVWLVLIAVAAVGGICAYFWIKKKVIL